MILSLLILALMSQFPFASANPTDAGIYADGLYDLSDQYLALGLSLSMIGLILLNIFNFNKRKLQLKINLTALLLGLGLEALVLYTIFSTQADLAFAAVLPAVAILFLFLANKGIQKDEKLIKDSDRLR